jgi:hypothetical protein
MELKTVTPTMGRSAMGNRSKTLLVSALVVWGAAACSNEPARPAADRLTAALADAEPGDRIRIGAGTVTGSFRIPPGVTLEGQGEGETFVVAPAGQDEPAVVLEPGSADEATTVRGLTVASDAGYAVTAAGDGAGTGNVQLENVEVRVQLGLGIGIQDVERAALTNVRVQGPISLEAPNGPSNATPANSASHGIVLVRVQDAQLAEVTANGFALFGALFVDSTTTWSGGAASENMGTGTMVHGGAADLNNVEFCDELQGVRLLPAFGAVFTAGADVASEALNTCNTEGVGLFHADASGRHTDIAATGNAEAAMWVQDSTDFELRGAGTMVADNGLAGVIAVNSSGLLLRDGEIRSTELAPRVLAEAGLIEVGDGVQLVGSTDDVVLNGLRLTENARVGMLLDLEGDSTTGITFEQVTVDGSGEQLGVIGQDGELRPGWDQGVARMGATLTNDVDFTGTLDVVMAVSPTDYPTADEVATGGLEVFGAVSPTD